LHPVPFRQGAFNVCTHCELVRVEQSAKQVRFDGYWGIIGLELGQHVCHLLPHPMTRAVGVNALMHGLGSSGDGIEFGALLRHCVDQAR